LIGVFGHILKPDPIDHKHQIIQFQFQVIGQMRDRCRVRLLSLFDGRPSGTMVMSEATLLGDTIQLYANEKLWLAAARKINEDKRQRREEAIARKVRQQ
jgi:hypothetical protein